VAPHKPVALDRDERVKLDSLYPKRQNTVGLKMYVHSQKSAAGFGIRGTEMSVQNSLEQAMKQNEQALMNPEMKNDPESQYKMERMKDR
jgi:hypothetical protein